MSNKENYKYDRVKKIIKFFNLDNSFDDEFEDDYDFNTEFYKEKELKENVRDKLLTDEKYTFEEYFTLLELVSNKFKTSFNSGNGKYEIIFRERTFDERFKLNKDIEKQSFTKDGIETKRNEER